MGSRIHGEVLTMDWVMKKKRSVCAAAALVMACNVESLVQDFHDQHGPGTDTAESSGGSTGRGGESTTGVVGMEEGSGGVETSGSGGGSTGSSGEVAGTTGGSTGEESTTGEAVVAECGNSVVEGDEECDDPGDTRCHKCVRDRLVFVTSKNVYGDFAERELAGYDYMCNHLAAVAGLLTNSQPRFKPWVSTSEGERGGAAVSLAGALRAAQRAGVRGELGRAGGGRDLEPAERGREQPDAERGGVHGHAAGRERDARKSLR
jgi:hypothetical protein